MSPVLATSCHTEQEHAAELTCTALHHKVDVAVVLKRPQQLHRAGKPAGRGGDRARALATLMQMRSQQIHTTTD